MLKPGLNDKGRGVEPNREGVLGAGEDREVLGVGENREALAAGVNKGALGAGENREVLAAGVNKEAFGAGVDGGKLLEKSEFPGVVDIVAFGLEGPAIGLKPLNVVICDCSDDDGWSLDSSPASFLSTVTAETLSLAFSHWSSRIACSACPRRRAKGSKTTATVDGVEARSEACPLRIP